MEKALLPILANLVEMHYPQFAKKRSASSPVVDVREGEDMLYALLGGQVQRRRHPNRSGTQTPASAPMPPNSAVNTNNHGPMQMQQTAAMNLQNERLMQQWGTLSMPIPGIPLSPAVSASQAAASSQMIYPQFPTPLGIAHTDMNYGNRAQSDGAEMNGDPWTGTVDTNMLQAQLANQSITGNTVSPTGNSLDISRPSSQTQNQAQTSTQSQSISQPQSVPDTADAAQLDQWYASQIQLDPMDVWTRLQTFYEPAVPLFHPAGAGSGPEGIQADGFGYGYGYAGLPGQGTGFDLDGGPGVGSGVGAWGEMLVGQPQMGYQSF